MKKIIATALMAVCLAAHGQTFKGNVIGNLIGDGYSTGIVSSTDGLLLPQTQIPSAALPAFYGNASGSGASVLMIGDSMSQNGYGQPSASEYLSQYLQANFGNNGEGFEGWWASFPTTLNRNENTNWPGIHWCVLYGSDGTNAAYMTQSQSFSTVIGKPINQVGFWWVAQPLGTNFWATVTAPTEGINTTVKINGYAATPTLLHTNFSTAGIDNQIVFSGWSGAAGTNYILPDFNRTNTPGIKVWWMAKGGLTITNFLTMIGGTNMLRQIGTNIQPDLIVYHAKDWGEENDVTTYTNVLTQLLSLLSYTNTHVIIVATPARMDQSPATDVADNLWQNYSAKLVCAMNGWCYADLYSRFNDTNFMLSSGIIYTPGVHPTDGGARLWAANLYSMICADFPTANAPTNYILPSNVVLDYSTFTPHLYNALLVGQTNNGAIGNMWLGTFFSGGLPALWYFQGASRYEMDLGAYGNYIGLVDVANQLFLSITTNGIVPGAYSFSVGSPSSGLTALFTTNLSVNISTGAPPAAISSFNGSITITNKGIPIHIPFVSP